MTAAESRERLSEDTTTEKEKAPHQLHESRKRLLEETSEQDKEAPYQLKEPPSMSKRRNIMTNTAKTTSKATKPPCFLLFHYKMLKSLYDEESSDEEGVVIDETSQQASSLLDAKIWKAMQDFLKERAKLLQAQTEAKDSQGVHLAAMAHLGKSSTTPTNSSPHSGVVIPGESPDPMFRRRTHEQATHSPSILQSPLNKALHTSFASLANASQTTHPRNAFRLVSVLLQKRANTLQKQYRRAAAPYQHLYTCCQEQIRTLTREIVDLQHALGHSTRSWRQQLVESPKSPPSPGSRLLEQTEERRSALAATQAKLQLWKLLHRDLGDAMMNEA